MTAVATAQQLDQLPLRALLAYAARCARRVEPFFAVGSDAAETERYRPVIAQAIRLAEAFAAGDDLEWKQVAQIEEACVRALLAVREAPAVSEQAAYAANAAYATINATGAALNSLDAADPTAALDNLREAVAIAIDAAKLAEPRVLRAAELDWEMLRRMCLGHYPDLGEPVDPTEQGILGPLFRERQRPAKAAPHAAPHASPAAPTRGSGATSPPAASRPTDGKTESEANGKPPKRKGRSAEKLKAAVAELKVKQEALHAEQAALQTERLALRELREAVVEERTRLREKSRLARKRRQAARKQINSLKSQLAELEARLTAQAVQCEAQQQELARAAAPSEQSEQLVQECRRLQAERDSLAQQQAEWQRQSADLLAAQDWLLAERTKLESLNAALKQERQHLERERAEFTATRDAFHEEHVRVAMQLDEARRTVADEAALVPPSLRRRGDTTPLRLLLKPGTASAEQVTDLLRTLATVYQQVSGWTLRFKLQDCRLRRLPEDRRHWPDFPESERAIVELDVSPRAVPNGPETRFDLARWNQFKTCLLIAIQLEGELIGLFADAHGSPRDHHARLVLTESLAQVEQWTAALDPQRNGGRNILPVEVINQQLQRLEESLRRLRLEERLVVELAPLTSGQDESPATNGDDSAEPSPSLLRRFLFFSAVVLLSTVGLTQTLQ